ncbi:MAG TPA: PAS domain-containing protein [Alphaproteobacteria bacterium]|nr:PAS domain-containing protein [Alphaproteobacteria bacterium]
MATAIADPILQAIYDYWASKRAPGAIPSRAAIDPVELPLKTWPYIMLIDVIEDEGRIRYRYRRVGGDFDTTFGWDPTGRYFDEVLPNRNAYLEYVARLYSQVVFGKLGLYSETIFKSADVSVPLHIRRLTLPLAQDGRKVDMILAGHRFERSKPRTFDLSDVGSFEEVKFFALE